MTEGGKSASRIITDLREKLLKDRTEEFAAKSVEHQVKEDLIQFQNESNQKKQKVLKEEKKNLEKIRDKMYNLENDFCESVWKFSKEHDFGTFLVNYPRVKKPRACDCKFYIENIKTIEKELEDNAEIQKMTREVGALKLEFETLSNAKNLEEEFKKASKELKCTSEVDAEIRRLMKVLKNSQQELENLQSDIEHFRQGDTLLKNLKIDSSPEIKKKRKKDDEKTSKKLKSIKKTPRGNKNSHLTYPNTIDNYLIPKGNKATLVEDKKVEESKMTTEIKKQHKSEISDFWSQISPDSVSFTDIENSFKDAYTFLENTKTLTKSEVFSTTQNANLNSLVAEGKSVSRAFIPKKQSAISEQFQRKY